MAGDMEPFDHHVERLDEPGEDAVNPPILARRSSRRALLARSAKKIAYTAPVVLLFRPRQAVAASGSNLTAAERLAPLMRPVLPQFGVPGVPGAPVAPVAPPL